MEKIQKIMQWLTTGDREQLRNRFSKVTQEIVTYDEISKLDGATYHPIILESYRQEQDLLSRMCIATMHGYFLYFVEQTGVEPTHLKTTGFIRNPHFPEDHSWCLTLFFYRKED